MSRLPSPDQRAARLASRQHGAIRRSQALEVGLTVRQIEWRLATGRWRLAIRGVYLVAGAPETWQQRCMVACLAGPPGTVASHLTAAALFGLAEPPAKPHVTVPPSASGRLRRAQVHHSSVPDQDRCLVGTIPSTSPARTIADCAARVAEETLYDLVDSALYRKLTDPAGIRRAVARSSRAPGRKGQGAIERALYVWVCGVRPGSPAEARVLRCLAHWGLPPPERQFVIRDAKGRFVATVDFAWPGRMSLLEYYGEEHHGPRRWQADDEREARLRALGWNVEVADKFDLRPSSTRLRDALRSMLGVAAA